MAKSKVIAVGTGRNGVGKAFSKLNLMTSVDRMNARIRKHKNKMKRASK